MFEHLGLASDLLASGVVQVDVDVGPDWGELFGGAGRIQCLVVEPTRWMAEQWPALLAAANASPVSISIYVPDHSPGAELELIAERYDLRPETLRETLKDLPRRIEGEWNAASGARRLDAGAEVSLRRYRGVPSLSGTLADRRGCVTVPGALGSRLGDAALTVTLDADSETAVVSWVRHQLDEFDRFTDIFYGSGA